MNKFIPSLHTEQIFISTICKKPKSQNQPAFDNFGVRIFPSSLISQLIQRPTSNLQPPTSNERNSGLPSPRSSGLASLQPFNPSTLQPFNLSTSQLLTANCQLPTANFLLPTSKTTTPCISAAATTCHPPSVPVYRHGNV